MTDHVFLMATMMFCTAFGQRATGTALHSLAGVRASLIWKNAAQADLAGGFFAIWIAGDRSLDPPVMAKRRAFQPIDVARAKTETMEMAAILIRMARARPDAIRICRSATADIATARAEGAIAALMHIEGTEGIGTDLDELHVYHAAGLRSLGPGLVAGQHLWPWRAV